MEHDQARIAAGCAIARARSGKQRFRLAICRSDAGAVLCTLDFQAMAIDLRARPDGTRRKPRERPLPSFSAQVLGRVGRLLPSHRRLVQPTERQLRSVENGSECDAHVMLCQGVPELAVLESFASLPIV